MKKQQVEKFRESSSGPKSRDQIKVWEVGSSTSGQKKGWGRWKEPDRGVAVGSVELEAAKNRQKTQNLMPLSGTDCVTYHCFEEVVAVSRNSSRREILEKLASENKMGEKTRLTEKSRRRTTPTTNGFRSSNFVSLAAVTSSTTTKENRLTADRQEGGGGREGQRKVSSCKIRLGVGEGEEVRGGERGRERLHF